jgi:hypothetical protein
MMIIKLVRENMYNLFRNRMNITTENINYLLHLDVARMKCIMFCVIVIMSNVMCLKLNVICRNILASM